MLRAQNFMSNCGGGGPNPPVVKIPVLENTTPPHTPLTPTGSSKRPAGVDSLDISVDSFYKQSLASTWHCQARSRCSIVLAL